MDYENFIFSLMDTEPAVFGGAVITSDGDLVYQTENWDLQQDIDQLNGIITNAQKSDGQNPGRLKIMKLPYMIVEFTPERVIATSVTKKGHIIIAMADNGSLITFIDPAKGPRDALFNVQTFARKL